MPQIRIRDASGTMRTISRIRVRDDSGTLRTIRRIRMRDAGGALRTVYASMSVSVAPDSVNGVASTSTIETDSTSVTVTGGVPPFSYTWRAVNGDNFDGIAATAPFSATTAFRLSSTAVGETYITFFECVVTDASGSTAVTSSVRALIQRI